MAENKKLTTETKFEEKDIHQAKLDVWKYVLGFAEMAVIKCAIQLRIPEAIEANGGLMTLPELSSTLNGSQSHLARIMRFLAHRNIFKQQIITDQSGSATLAYTQTPLSTVLMSRTEDSMASLVLLESSPIMLGPWHGLTALVLGRDDHVFETANGEDLWRYAAANPAHSQLINEAMACDARMSVPVILDDLPHLFDGIQSVVDVGGGNGTSLCVLVKSCPWIRGINFDLPHVVSALPELIGIEHVGGDMFVNVPKADAVFIKWVLHDWGDEECIKILKNCREAVPKDKGIVILVEAVIEEGDENKIADVGLLLDMVMMAHTHTGKERTRKEWSYVLDSAGFSRYTFSPIRAVQSIIQAFP